MTEAIAIPLMSAGVIFFLAGSVGLIRFPDTCSRLHALTKADNLGLGLIAAAVMLQAPAAGFAAKAALVWLVTIFSSAVTSYLIAQQALTDAGENDADDDG